jgi:hypothetical protein
MIVSTQDTVLRDRIGNRLRNRLSNTYCMVIGRRSLAAMLVSPLRSESGSFLQRSTLK